MVWNAISFHSRTSLVVIHSKLTALQYVDEVLRPVGLPFMSRYPGITFKQYNARSHTAHFSTDCISTCWTLPCPTRSRDLSRIEYVWSIIGRALLSACDVDDLTRQLDRIWNDILQEDIRNLYQSMPSRITACIRARGEQTRYWLFHFVKLYHFNKSSNFSQIVIICFSVYVHHVYRFSSHSDNSFLVRRFFV